MPSKSFKPSFLRFTTSTTQRCLFKDRWSQTVLLQQQGVTVETKIQLPSHSHVRPTQRDFATLQRPLQHRDHQHDSTSQPREQYNESGDNEHSVNSEQEHRDATDDENDDEKLVKEEENTEKETLKDEEQKTSQQDEKAEESRAEYQRPKGMSHYDVIGVKPTASLKDLKKAYKQKARELHPDMNPDDSSAARKFVDLQIAYQVLSSPLKRSDYDQSLKPEKEQKGRTTFMCARKRYTGNLDAKYWKTQWEQETPQQKVARRERYEAFATGNFKDPEGMVFKNKNIGVGVEFFGVLFPVVLAFVSYYKLGITTRDPEEEFDDFITSSDWRGVKYVDSYLNPFTLDWDRLAEGQEPPTPEELRLFYCKVYGPLAVNRDVYPSKVLTRVKMPKTQTTAPVMFRDLKTGKSYDQPHHYSTLLENIQALNHHQDYSCLS